MSVYVMNGFKPVTESRFFGKVNGIVVDNVYDNTIFYRVINEINKKKIEYYESNDCDLSILKQCPTIKYISISGEAALNDLIGLENIRGISIGLPIGDNESFDFCRLPHVNMLSIHADGKNHTWMKMDWLKILYIHEYLNSDLKAFSIRGLEQLTLNMSRIETLDGIENFPSLRYFEVDYCKKLKMINKLVCLKSLEMLKISDCNGVEDLEEIFSRLKALKELSILTLETVAPQYLKSLSFIKEMKALQSFKSNYVIVDKDLTPLLRLKNAEIFEDKSYYKIKNKNLPKWDKDK